MALFAHSSYALSQLEFFNVSRNVDFNLRTSLRSQLGCDWLIVRSDIDREESKCSACRNDEWGEKKLRG